MDFETKYETVRIALRHMYKERGYLDICTIDKCVKLLSVIVPDEEYQMLHTLHCVHFNEMSKELRAKVIQALMDMFHVDNIMVELGFLEMIGKAEAVLPQLISFKVEEEEEEKEKPRKRLFGLIGGAS